MSYPLPEGVIVAPEDRPAPGPLVVKLSRPIREGERKLESLTLQPLRAVHVRKIAKEWERTEDVLAIAQHLTGQPEVVLDQLVGADVGAVTQATLEQLWPVRDVPAQWEALADALDKAGAEHQVPKCPRLEGPVTLELEHELRHGTDVVTRLEFGEVTGRIAKGFGLGGLPLSRTPWLVEQLTGARAELVDQLTGVDLNRALALAQAFFFSTRPKPLESGSSSPSASAGPPLRSSA